MSSLLEGIIEICVTMSTRKINKSSAVRQKKKIGNSLPPCRRTESPSVACLVLFPGST